MSDPSATTARAVLSLPAMAGFEILGGAAGLERAAHDAHVVAPGNERTTAAHSIVFLTSTESLGTELALAGLSERGAAAVIVDHDVLVSTRWLADRFGLPLVRHTGDRGETAFAVRTHLRQPRAERGLACADAARRLAGADSPSGVAAVVSAVLGHRVSVVGLAGVQLAESETPVRNHLDDGTTPPAETTVHSSTPIGNDAGARLSVAVHAPTGIDDEQVETIRAVADLAIVRLTAWAARSALTAAWDQASQGALLAHMLTAGSLDGPRAEQAIALGWQIDGFHIAAVVRTEDQGVERSMVLAALQNALVATGVTVPAVPLADGWVWWTSSPSRPTPAQVALRSNDVRQIVADLAPYGLAAGVSGADYGMAGLVRAIGDAGRLSRIAGHAPGRRRVETSSDSNPRQYLLTAVTDDQARRRAALLLQPLRDSADSDLLDTLNVYLLAECSTSGAARRLGVHRNSVLKRLARIETMLGIDLNDDDTRLALRIACRAL